MIFNACSKTVLAAQLVALLAVLSMPVCEPIVVTGSMVPAFLGKPVQSLRIVNCRGAAIPFQIDEVAADQEYACPDGKEPMAGNGVLDTADEIVFLWEDADTMAPSGAEDPAAASGRPDAAPKGGAHRDSGEWIFIEHATQRRAVRLADDPTIPLSAVRYLQYDDRTKTVTTPFYYAAFAPDRFYFVKAGVKDFSNNSFIDLTNELRIQLYFRALWGLLPISYSENNMVCFVKRYKLGPIRLIRRGDFHLNLGLWIKGSHAAVNQLCYPDMVRVPVHVHLPMHFRSLFGQAYIEMTPVIRKGNERFTFRVPQYDIAFSFKGRQAVDSLVPANPNRKLMTIDNGTTGYGWLLDANMQEEYIQGSGYVVRKPSQREGLCDCGFRLTVRDLPKGNYLITNWVLFSNSAAAPFALEQAGECITNRARIFTRQAPGALYNQLTKHFPFKKQ